MFATTSIRGRVRGFSNILCNKSQLNPIRRNSLVWFCLLVQDVPDLSLLSKTTSFTTYSTYTNQRKCKPEGHFLGVPCKSYLFNTLLLQRSCVFEHHNVHLKWLHARYTSNASIELKTGDDVVRFNIGKQLEKRGSPKKWKKTAKHIKRNELRLYRLKAKKKMTSPNPEVRIRYKLDKAKRKEEWLIEKLRKFEVPKDPAETYDPEILTEEERFYLKRTGEKKKNYVPVGRRGVFGGVVLNMHLHWKKHETVKVICKPCKPGQIHEYAEELARLSKGIVIDIKPNNTIIFYRGKNYVQPKIMSPPDTLSKAKALEKYKYEQSLEHTSQFIEKLEKELEEYHKHLDRYRKRKENEMQDSVVDT
ncbi:uncharacterized CRM domain-containing protein At3g25440, chloroplastic [Cornus florida]|uniref:uncharacterized CRM domain-containing protein At3g25440, chloroplastic n=1 Tax=Cornus florida TaxID=4283 RepID=UPI00289D2BA7|nr:uncharacterized CRM domain-containing protein At3g25440, chloroplastic [Cornus florida]